MKLNAFLKPQVQYTAIDIMDSLGEPNELCGILDLSHSISYAMIHPNSTDDSAPIPGRHRPPTFMPSIDARRSNSSLELEFQIVPVTSPGSSAETVYTRLKSSSV